MRRTGWRARSRRFSAEGATGMTCSAIKLPAAMTVTRPRTIHGSVDGRACCRLVGRAIAPSHPSHRLHLSHLLHPPSPAAPVPPVSRAAPHRHASTRLGTFRPHSEQIQESMHALFLIGSLLRQLSAKAQVHPQKRRPSAGGVSGRTQAGSGRSFQPTRRSEFPTSGRAGGRSVRAG